MPDIIILTENPALVASLRAKLDEYNERYAYTAPECTGSGLYKCRLLSALLNEGWVNVDTMREWAEGLSFFRPSHFDNAVSVIRHYNAGEVDKVRGGTGLRGF